MARSYDKEYKVQAVKLAREIGGDKAAKELGIPKGHITTITIRYAHKAQGRREAKAYQRRSRSWKVRQSVAAVR